MTVAPFSFFDAVRLNCPTGASASTLREFRDAVERADAGVLHHHLRETPLRFTFTTFEYPNDFALWVGDALGHRALAERLAMLDPFHARVLEALRQRVLDLVETAFAEEDVARPVPRGQEFHFSASVSVEFALGIEASTVGELRERLAEVPGSSIFYHFYEARLRNPGGADDLSAWLELAGHEAAASRLRDLDIYLLSLDACRRVAQDLLGEGR
ncbi:MAG: DUF5752 family protein [Thermoanaerobaculales bacterium]